VFDTVRVTFSLTLKGVVGEVIVIFADGWVIVIDGSVNV